MSCRRLQQVRDLLIDFFIIIIIFLLIFDSSNSVLKDLERDLDAERALSKRGGKRAREKPTLTLDE
jgi:hypothetical protein